MRSRTKMLAAPLLILVGLGLTACGGDDSERRRTTPTWAPSDRLPSTANHWWWDPVERYCEDANDCANGERCEQMQLGTCPGCPRGEDARICLDDQGRNAAERTRRSSDRDPAVTSRSGAARSSSSR